MTVGSITAGGLISGMDTESLITQMMEIEQRPILLLQQREAAYQAKISGLGSLKSVLSELQSAVGDLKDADNFVSYSASSSDTGVLTVSSSDSAAPGTYNVTVNQLARAQQVRSASFIGGDAAVGSGTLTLQLGSGDSTEIVIDEENNTVADIAAAINEADAGVSAGVLDDGHGNVYLTLMSQETGAENTITLTVEDDDGDNEDASGLSSLYTDNLTETQSAQNAEVVMNGVEVERSGNTIDDLLEGVTLTLKKEDPGVPVTVKVSKNNAGAVSKAQAFVDQYNALVETFDMLQSYDQDTGQAGLLLGDRTTNILRNRLRGFLTYQVEGVAESVNGLSRIGIGAERDGTLTLDSEALTAALEEHYEDVVNFFTLDDDSGEGLAVSLYDTIEGYVKSTGVLASKEDGLQSSIDDVEDQIESIQDRLVQREERLRAQFQALENLLAEYQTTESLLTQQITSLTNLREAISNG